MKNDFKIIPFVLPVLILFLIISGSCSGRKTKTEHKNIIPEKVLINILTEVHIADGLLSNPKISNMYSTKDSVTAYMDIMEKHGYSKETMDKTMRYYFIRKPKRLIKIYDQVLAGLSEMESRYMNEALMLKGMETDLWPAKRSYALPDPFGTDTAWFDIPLNVAGTYTLRFSVILYPDDQSVNPKPGLYFYYPENPDTLKRDYFTAFNFVKDGRRYNYSFTKSVSWSTAVSLKGWFIDYENQHPGIVKHVLIENISLTKSRVE